MKKEDDVYPCTIVHDRYGGVYSGAKWIAFPQDYDHVNEAVGADDVSCCNYWNEHPWTVGRGETPQEAYEDLVKKLKKPLNQI